MNWRFWKNGVTVRLSDVPEIVARTPGTDVYNVADATIDGYRAVCNLMIAFMGDKTVGEITRQEMAEYDQWIGTRTSRRGRPLAIGTINGYRIRTRAVWNRLVERGYDVCDIDGLFRKLQQGTGAPRAISEADIKRLLARCSVRDAAMILLAARSGIRQQTLRRIRVDSVKLWRSPSGERRFAASIPQEKTSAPRVAFAGHDAATLVEAHLLTRAADSKWLFSKHNGEQLTREAVRGIWSSAVKRAHLPQSATPAAWHSLRHHFAQTQLDAGHDARIVAEWMGISVDSLLKTYANPRLERMAAQFFGEDIDPGILREIVTGDSTADGTTD